MMIDERLVSCFEDVKQRNIVRELVRMVNDLSGRVEEIHPTLRLSTDLDTSDLAIETPSHCSCKEPLLAIGVSYCMACDLPLKERP